jgi:UDP-N-acetylglucosamine--N-acetylmuramyl-(pentapeptide) pyrophosphoryl-undecaprenol N-acetylglucosamine transferase
VAIVPTEQQKPTVILAGGGTGGHVYPALALGEAMARRGHPLRYYGDAARLEGRVVPERGIDFHPIPAMQYPRGGVVGKLRFASALLRNVLFCRRLLREHRAGLVLGVGGYISAPPVLAAWSLGIPTAVHEANVTPGLANRLCARVADLVLLTYAATGPKLPGKAPRHTVGCPVNPKVLQGDRAAAAKRYGLDPARPTLLVVGGSLGAATINQLGIALAKDPARAWQVALVTGPSYFDATSAALSPLPVGVAVVAYEDRIADAYALADLVMCRAGSSTLAELALLGKPAILVPSPNVTDNHQEHNARGIEAEGAAVVIVERDLDVKAAVGAVAALMADAAARAKMAEQARRLGRPDTAEQVADLLVGLLGPR